MIKNGRMENQYNNRRPHSAASQKRNTINGHRRTLTPTPVTLSSSKNITKEVDDPSPDVGTWRRSLRSPSPSGNELEMTGARLSPSPTRKNEMTKTTDSFDFSRYMESLDRSLNDTTELENEYVKSLQTQVQILDMDNKYLRERGLKVSQMHPSMMLEAEAMLKKLKELQARTEGLELEIYRKAGDVDRLTKVNDHLAAKIKDEMDIRVQEKQALMNDVVRLKRDKDALERDLAKQDTILQEINVDHTNTLNSLRITETRLEGLKSDLNSHSNVTESAEKHLFDVRERLAESVSNFVKAEKKAITCEPLPEDIREQEVLKLEVSELRSRLTAVTNELDANLGRRNNLSDEVAQQVKENVALSQLLSHMKSDMEKIRSMRDNVESQRSQENLNTSHMSNRINELQSENDRLRSDLEDFKSRNIATIDSIKQFEEKSSGTMRSSTLAQTRLKDIEYSCKNLAEENRMLQREKNYLIDQVEAVQLKLTERSGEVLGLDKHVCSLTKRVEELDRLARMEQDVQSMRWAELAKLADDVRGFASRRTDGYSSESLPPSGKTYNPKRYS